MVIRDRYEEKVRQHYEKTGEQLLIAEQSTGRPIVVKPESEGFGTLVNRTEREFKGSARWV
jgi:hypothetical protein